MQIEMLGLLLGAGVGMGGMHIAFHTDLVERIVDRLPAPEKPPLARGEIEAFVPIAPAARVAPPPPVVGTGAAGATPAHYRAFSLMDVRCDSDAGFRKALVSFRTTAKTIRDERDPVARTAALKVMDHFVDVAEAYAKLWDETADGRRTALRNRTMPTIRRLHAGLVEALAASDATAEKTFAVEQRFVELKYDPEAAT